MPRLRVLNLRNNRMGRLYETNFRNLRSNIAVLDVEGNPIDCSCETLWLRAWLQETNSLLGPVSYLNSIINYIINFKLSKKNSTELQRWYKAKRPRFKSSRLQHSGRHQSNFANE